MKETIRSLKTFETIEEANKYIREMVEEDCSHIGIRHRETIDYILSVGDHQYGIGKLNFSFGTFYEVYLKVRALA